MARPCKNRWVGVHAIGRVFKPAGIPFRNVEQLELQIDELEALRQAHLLARTQDEGAAEMGISRATFSRILDRASRKVADALINGKGLVIKGGPVIMAKRTFTCFDCKHTWEEPFGTGKPLQCPNCKSVNITRADAGPRGVCGSKGGSGGGGAGARGGGRGQGSCGGNQP